MSSVKTWLMILLASLVLGGAFTGSSYFVTSEEDVVFGCFIPPNVLKATNDNNTYKETKNGFPFAFYTKLSAPNSDGCQSANGTPMVAIEQFSKEEFAKDMLIYTSVFFVLGAFLFGVRKKQ